MQDFVHSIEQTITNYCNQKRIYQSVGSHQQICTVQKMKTYVLTRNGVLHEHKTVFVFSHIFVFDCNSH